MSKKKPTKTPIQRWKQGIPHHPRSIEIIQALSDLDWEFMEGSLDIRTGGDGDNGEQMMYLLDIYFERSSSRANQKEDRC